MATPTNLVEALTTPQEVDVGKVAEALAELWKRADAAEDEGGSAVVRACGLTVIAIATGSAAMGRIRAQLGAATAAVPARTLIVELAADVHKGLSVEVAAFCSIGPRGAKQVCQEQVVLHAAKDRVADVAPLVTPLPIADLPVVLYLDDPALLDSELLDQLLPVVDILVTDTANCRDLVPVYRRFLEIEDVEQIAVRDLVFERLETWRESIAATYEELQNGPLHVDGVRLLSARTSSQGALLLGWLESRLADQRPAVQRFEDVDSPPEDDAICSVELTFSTARGHVKATFRQLGCNVARELSHGADVDCELPKPVPHDDLLLTRILGDPQADAAYDASLRAALARMSRHEPSD